MLCLGTLMIVLDVTIVGVALPSIKADLGFSSNSIAWVVNAYLLTFGGCLLLGVRLGDLYGHRRLFLIGLGVFTLASLACGLSNSQGLLIAARAAAVALPATVQSTRSPVVITVRLIQEATYQYPHPPPVGLVLSTTLRLFAVGTTLGLPNNAFLGTMSFTYQLHGTCSASTTGCSGTTNLVTLTKFPGGTITANGNHISLSHPLILVKSGTGIFKGVTGTIDIVPEGAGKQRLPPHPPRELTAQSGGWF